MALNHLFERGAQANWSIDSSFDYRSEHIDVDLRGMKLKNVTVTLDDDTTRLRVDEEIRQLIKDRDGLDADAYVDKAIIQAKIDVLRKVIK